MSRRTTISAYLAAPTTPILERPQVTLVLKQFAQVRANNPRLLQRVILALVIWSGVVGTIQNITSVRPVSSTGITLGGFSTTTPGSPQADPLAASVPAPVTAAATLPDGPSGQLLPPGTMAPDKTYRNNYAWGQCTWYVAGRRQIPSDWHNAKDWYYHAISRGWSVGTTPAVAAIAWNGPYTNGAGSYGHVALVEAVSANGAMVTVSEMNYNGINVKSTRTVPASQFKYIY